MSGNRLKNERWERFSQLYAADPNGTKAYKEAGYKAKTDSVAATGARNLLRKPQIQERLAELATGADKKRKISREAILDELAKYAFVDPESDDAPEGIKPTDSIRALELLGKRFALWIEKHEHDGPQWRDVFERLPVAVQEQIVAEMDKIDFEAEARAADGGG